MRKIVLVILSVLSLSSAFACTNFIVGKKASADGSVFVTYNADSYGAFMPLYHYPAAKHQAGEMRKVFEWDTNKYLGEIPEAEETYNVIGNSNEWQVTIGETTFGGREEMADSTGIIDYGSLIYIALQRSKTAREALQVMTSLVEQYGYCSEGETFSVADKDEAWMLEMMGCGPDRTKEQGRTVWVAVRIPDDAIAAHANQSRITKFLDGRYVQVKMKDLFNPKAMAKAGRNAQKLNAKSLVVFSDNVVSYARKMGWFEGNDADFSYNAAYAKPDFSGRRYCEARVWSFFNRFADDFSEYVPYAAGIEKDAKEMPLWIIPNKKVSLEVLPSTRRATSAVVSSRCLTVRHRCPSRLTMWNTLTSVPSPPSRRPGRLSPKCARRCPVRLEPASGLATTTATWWPIRRCTAVSPVCRSASPARVLTM